MRYRFGDYILDTARYELYRASVCLPLRPKVFQLLTYLLAHRDRVVGKDELLAHLWPNQFVGETTLKSCIRDARRALDDSGQAQRYIQTRHGHGYRFIAAVTIEDQTLFASATPAVPFRVPVPPYLDSTTAPGPLTETLSTAAGPPAREYKQVTVLCCTLAHATTLATSLGPEAMHALMQEVFALARPIVRRYEGTITRYTGEGFMALFGAPVAQEDHARRAVLAALELQQRLGAYHAATPLPLDVALDACLGVHTGPVVVGPLDSDARQLYTATGATTQLATRLQQLATPGSVVMSEATYQLMRHEVQSEAVGSMATADTAAAVAVYRVLGLTQRRAGVSGRGARGLSRFVGRAQELAILHERLAYAAKGQGQVVGIIGESGMGKSRLLYEFVQSLSGQAVTYREGHCLAYGSTTPYLPVRHLLQQHCGITEADGPEAITASVRRAVLEAGVTAAEEPLLLLQLLDVPMPAERSAQPGLPAQRARTFTLLRQVFLHDSQRQPLVLAVENAHWIDATSEEWLTTLVERLSTAAILLLVTYRPGYRPPWVERSIVTQIALPRLLPHEGLAVVQSVLDTTPLPDRLVSELLAKAGGNPFFLEELAWSVVEHGAREAPLLVPDTIQAVLAARLDRLPAEEKHLLQTAAVIGKDIPFALLQALTRLPEEALHRRLRHLQSAEFLYEVQAVPAPTYTFKHVLTQEVAYQSLLADTRREVHQRIAQILEAQFPETAQTRPELLAHHYTAAGCHAPAVVYWQRAGQRAIGQSAYAEALRQLTQGLELLVTLPDTPERRQCELDLLSALSLAVTAVESHAAPEVGRIATRAWELYQHLETSAPLVVTLRRGWSYHLLRAEVHRAHELAAQFLTLAQHQQDPALLVASHYGLGVVLYFLGAGAAALTHLEQAIALYDPQQHADPQTTGALRNYGVGSRAYAASVLWLLGYPDQAQRQSHEALTQAQALAHPFTLATTLNRAATLHQCNRDVQMVRERAEASMTLSTAQGFAMWLAQATILRGWALAMQGQGEEGIVQIQQGLDAWRATGSELAVPSFLALLAEAYGTVGRAADGLAALDEALSRVHSTGERRDEAELYRLKGTLLLAHSPHYQAEAETCFRHALEVACSQQARSWELRAAMSLSRLWQQQGKRDEARRLLAGVYHWFTEGFETADLKDAGALLVELA
jgi:class 3 adenylate cyclase/tetratricopeptide (TPR) repeat protein